MTSTVTARSLAVEAQAIREESARWLRAADTRDADAVAMFYAEDGAFLVPNVPLARGRDAVRAVWAQLLAAPNLELAWTPGSVDVAQNADVAYEIGSYRLAMDGQGGRIEDDGKYVAVWKRGERGWQVAADIFNSSRPLA